MTSCVEFSTLTILLVLRKFQHLEHFTLWIWGLEMLEVYRLDPHVLEELLALFKSLKETWKTRLITDDSEPGGRQDMVVISS